MKLSIKRSILVLAFPLCFGACSEQQSTNNETIVAEGKSNPTVETIYINGRIYTVDDEQPWAEALAITAGKYIAVGSNIDVQELADTHTEIIDLQGRFVMPGIHDLHVHPQQAGEKYNFHCSFPFTYTMDEIIAKISECAANTPKGEWIIGGQWANELIFEDKAPHKKILDAITTDHPVHLGDSTVHAAWLNTKALNALGIGADTPDPKGGVIVREAGSNEPTGVLFDSAYYNTMRDIPKFSNEQYDQAIAWAMSEMNKVGVTSIKDALSEYAALAAFKRLNDRNELTMKVATSIGWRMAWADTPEREQENLINRAVFSGKNVNTDFLKIMLDGIPPQRTAAMLEPYVPDEKHGDNYRGKLNISPEQLSKDLVELDAKGITVKIHATGDRSLRVALDAFEAARNANGDSGLLHEVSHAELIHDDDLARFKELNVVAEMCPILWYESPLVTAMAIVIGRERADRFWPIKSLLDTGALLVYGSDWPSVVPDPNPWPGLEAMVTRVNPYTNAGSALAAEQAIDLETALRIFTINGAIGNKMQDRTGSIEMGKDADFIVLDRNLFEIPIYEISDTQVMRTVIDGTPVYQQ